MVPVALVVVVLVIVFPVASTFIAVLIQRLPPTPISTNTLTTHPPVVNPLLYFITFHQHCHPSENESFRLWSTFWQSQFGWEVQRQNHNNLQSNRSSYMQPQSQQQQSDNGMLMDVSPQLEQSQPLQDTN
jgi:hypothetical protein